MTLIETYSNALRGVIIPKEGHKLFVSDFASIEARVTAWIAGQEDALEVYCNGGDPYCTEATGIYGRDITKADKDERAIGKVSVLALGYQGGINAYGSMSRIYGINLEPVYDMLWPSTTDDERDRADYCYNLYMNKHGQDADILSAKSALIADVIKQRWRKKNGRICLFWNEIESAAIEAVQSLGQVELGKLRFAVQGEFLYCRLPSGRCLAYHKPVVTFSAKGDPKLTYMSWNSMIKKYVRRDSYGGLLTENVVQAISRDLMAEAMLRLEEKGYTVILTIHDEIVCEILLNFGSLEEFTGIMKESPKWADSLPIDAESFECMRYRKG